jgi:hypothetical protein
MMVVTVVPVMMVPVVVVMTMVVMTMMMTTVPVVCSCGVGDRQRQHDDARHEQQLQPARSHRVSLPDSGAGPGRANRSALLGRS